MQDNLIIPEDLIVGLQNRKDSLNLMSFDFFKSILEQSKAY